MNVQIKGLFTGRLNTMDLPVTPGQLARWREGEAPLVAMPGLNPDQLEFLVSGMTPAERRERFGPLAVRYPEPAAIRRQKTRAAARKRGLGGKRWFWSWVRSTPAWGKPRRS